MKQTRKTGLRLALTGLLTAALMAGCAGAVRTAYKRPALDLPAAWQNQADTGQKVLAKDRWWEVFQDPALNKLIAKALETNNDLAAATIKVRKAQLTAGLAATNLWPDVSVRADTGGQKDLDSGQSSHSSGATASLSYEIDLWGKLAATRDAAKWEALATEADRANTALSLIGTTADLYWQIAYLNQAVDTSQESIDYSLEALKLVQAKYDAGAVSKLDLLNAEQDVESQKASLSDLTQQLAEARTALAVLFNQAPEHETANPKRLAELPLPTLSAGIPAAILGNRPDLKAAEMRLRSTLADTDTTRASYYPSLSLTSSLGTSSRELFRFLQNPVASLGAGLSLPFVQWNQAKLNTQIAEATYAQAVVEFRQTLYAALEDVENALSARGHYLEQEEALHRKLTFSTQAEAAAKVRYQSGETGLQSWLDQQQNQRTAQLDLAKNRYNQLTNLMRLYQALGGGSTVHSTENTIATN